MAKKGHLFPASHGFNGSTGKVQMVKGYSRKVPAQAKKAVGGIMRSPVGVSGPKLLPNVRPAPIMRTPQPIRRGALAYADGGRVGGQTKGPVDTDTIGDQGNAAVKRGKPFISQTDVEYGGTGPLRSGYRKGGKVRKANGGVPYTGEGPMSDKDATLYAKAAAANAVKKHVAAPAPKGHKGFSKIPMFGKK